VIAVDRVPERLALAMELGATHTIDATEQDAAARIAEITGGRGVDHTVESTGSTAVLRLAVDALAVGGSCAVVGAPPFGAEVAVDVNGLLPGRRIVGVTEGDSEPETLIPFLVRQYRTGRLPLQRLVTEFPFDSIEKAADAVHTGQVIKPVLRFGGA
jgi:aryl-alcohol dehydrogenase